MSYLPSVRVDEPAGRGRAAPERGAAAAAALAAATTALRTVPVPREALRGAVIRYAAIARDEGGSAGDVTRALEGALGPALAAFPAAIAADLRVHLAWWAAHGFHRAD